MKVNDSEKVSFPESCQPIAAEVVLSEKNLIKEPRLVDNWLLWLEQRPLENGRITVLIRPWKDNAAVPQELTPSPIDLRTRVHGYGGASLASLANDDKLVLCWLDDNDGCLWQQTWIGLKNLDKEDEKINLEPLHNPICLSDRSEFFFAGGLIDLKRNRWIGVMEKENKDYLVTFLLNQEYQEPKIIYNPKDFIGYLTLSPNQNLLAWVEWESSFMPWDASELHIGIIDKKGDLLNTKKIAGNCKKDQKSISIFQPTWLANGELVVVEDSSGWWNLMISGPDFYTNEDHKWNYLWPMSAEVGVPQWVYGMSTISAFGNKIVGLICKEGKWIISIFTKDGLVEEIKQPFDDLSYLNVCNGKIVVLASNAFNESGLLEIDFKDQSWLHTPTRKLPININQISSPEPFWFKGFDNKIVHSWYYPPINGSQASSPLLVKAHSGPTGMANTGLNLEIQFWTSRGWGVLDVNYGGSTGFGREYRERLRSNWGKVDICDCSEGALAVVQAGKANKELIAIEGGSAAGYTALASLCFRNVFKIAACRYAVSDLYSMSHSTHRFERNYLDYLIGSLDEKSNEYFVRSPQKNCEKINSPVIFFHGLKDTVVYPDQTINIVNKLSEKKLIVEIHLFDNEGHGFRDAKVKLEVLKLTEKFFRENLLEMFSKKINVRD